MHTEAIAQICEFTLFLCICRIKISVTYLAITFPVDEETIFIHLYIAPCFIYSSFLQSQKIISRKDTHKLKLDNLTYYSTTEERCVSRPICGNSKVKTSNYNYCETST